MATAELDLPADTYDERVFMYDITWQTYEPLRVPEIWRYNGRRLHVALLSETGEYCRATRSPTFPGFPLVRLQEMLERRNQLIESEMMQAFRQPVRGHPNRSGSSMPRKGATTKKT